MTCNLFLKVKRSREGGLKSLERTEYIEADLEAIFASSVTSNVREQNCYKVTYFQKGISDLVHEGQKVI